MLLYISSATLDVSFILCDASIEIFGFDECRKILSCLFCIWHISPLVFICNLFTIDGEGPVGIIPTQKLT